MLIDYGIALPQCYLSETATTITKKEQARSASLILLGVCKFRKAPMLLKSFINHNLGRMLAKEIYKCRMLDGFSDVLSNMP